MVAENITQISRVEPSVGLERTTEMAAKWARERVDLIKKQICPTGITDGEFQLFVEQCKRADLDPLLGEAFCVPRRVKVGNDWTTKHVMQPAEAGMEARADRFPDFRGLKAAAVYEGEQCVIGETEVRHSYDPCKRAGKKLIGAWAQAFREGRAIPVVWCDFESYAQRTRDGALTEMWRTKPATMIAKCARAAALRLAYPNAFGGIYIKEEELPEEPESDKRLKTRAPPPQAKPQPPTRPQPKPASARVVEGEVVQSTTVVAEAKTAGGSTLRISEPKTEGPPPPSDSDAPPHDSGTGEVREPGSDDGPRAADDLMGRLSCCSTTDELRAWLESKNTAQARGELTKDDLECLRKAYGERSNAIKRGSKS